MPAPSAPPHVSGDVVAAVALGGAVGSLARWGVAEALPHSAGAVAWSTVVVNVTGALLLGLLLAFLAGPGRRHHLLRPLLGTGLLGGWTTFSTAMLDTHDLLLHDAAGLLPAGGYLAGSVVAGVLAVWLGLRAGRRLSPAATRPWGEPGDEP